MQYNKAPYPRHGSITPTVRLVTRKLSSSINIDEINAPVISSMLCYAMLSLSLTPVAVVGQSDRITARKKSIAVAKDTTAV